LHTQKTANNPLLRTVILFVQTTFVEWSDLLCVFVVVAEMHSQGAQGKLEHNTTFAQ
jgi:hypothetical protein